MKTKFHSAIAALCFFSFVAVNPAMAWQLLEQPLTSQQALELAFGSLRIWIDGDDAEPGSAFFATTADAFNYHEPFMRGGLSDNADVEIAYTAPGEVSLGDFRVRPSFGAAIVSDNEVNPGVNGAGYLGKLIAHRVEDFENQDHVTWRVEAVVIAPHYANRDTLREYRVMLLYTVTKPVLVLHFIDGVSF